MDIGTFIERWSQARGGAERANYQMSLSGLCEALDLCIDRHKRGCSILEAKQSLADRRGKRIEQRVVQALATLVRYGEVAPLPNGSYAARRAA